MNPALGTLLFTIVVPGTVVILVPCLVVQTLPPTTFGLGAFRYSGGLCILAGLAMYLHCAASFVQKGHGTPAPTSEPEKLVASGLYRYHRNPMYIGILSVLLGEAVLFESLPLLIYATATFLAFHLFVVLYEEPHLALKYGNAYEKYCKSVNRWLPTMRN